MKGKFSSCTLRLESLAAGLRGTEDAVARLAKAAPLIAVTVRPGDR